MRSFLKFFKRFIVANFSSLLLLFLGVFLPLLIFGELAEDVWESSEGFAWDDPILLAIHSTSRPELDIFAGILTQFGVYWGVFPVGIFICITLFLRHRWRWLVYFSTTLLGSIFINRIAKSLLHRVRPHLWVSPTPELDYGFPSGHAMSSMTLVAALVILTWETRWRWLVLIVGTIFVLAIGWTRLYLGVHYPSDIIAGWTASIAWATGVYILLKYFRR